MEINYLCWPCLSDGKTKVWWSGRTAMGSCYVCDATPLEMADRNHPKFKKPRKGTYKYGVGALHIRLRTFDWLVKFATHQDFKSWRIRYSKNCLCYSYCTFTIKNIIDTSLVPPPI